MSGSPIFFAADNYDVLLRVGQKIKLSAEAQPKNLEQHAMAAQVLSLAVIAHRGDLKQARAAEELMATIDKNEANPEAVKAAMQKVLAVSANGDLKREAKEALDRAEQKLKQAKP